MKELWDVLRPEEQIELQIRRLYQEHHFHLYQLNSFEEFEGYQQQRNFFKDSTIITFTGNDGRTMALKPDVTISIVKNTPSGERRKVYYVEDVYRQDRQEGEYQKIRQVGIEIIDNIGQKDELEVLRLAWQSLALVGEGTLDLSHMGIINAICEQFPQEERDQVLKALQHKSSHAMDELTQKYNLPKEESENLGKLLRLSGKFEQFYEKARGLLSTLPKAQAALDELKELHDQLTSDPELSSLIRLRLDFSIMNDADYYSGLLFQGFIKESKETILHGGRYDLLLKRQGKSQGAIGFGMKLNHVGEKKAPKDSEYLNIALPKGRMGDTVYQLFTKAGIASEGVFEDNRKLIFVDETNKLRFFLVKPSDVAIYVEHGAADIGVVGKDILLENYAHVIEFLDLHLGECRIAVAACNDFVEDESRPLRVSTKYSNITRDYYDSLGRSIELIGLHGSIELAPLLDLSDVIVDIVETGTTLKENNLKVIQDIAPSSARLIINHATWRFKQARIQEVIEKVRQEI
ncbi:ATP phosphoribosyltransferase [Candidatus Enterococcus ferrettii]|uniref:ATP phosphoribosyltransferase n=1 Tax=Candidatus Enterococcus ferrettii TaxID=2815324 RepID=A0ABV0EXX3_9ENTE|nr:ATP phosphoribosyltransferase [Enterococcus sp. 665A]MBO1342485.1 ATP phosphoribosyltransferase [Enterococcus sp. 665A]